MVGTVDFSQNRIANFYSSTRQALESSLQRIASGKKFRAPEDGVPEFMKVQKLRQDRRGYSLIQRDFGRARSVLAVAEKAGTHVVDNVERMKELVKRYWSEEDPVVKEGIKAEYDSLKTDIDRIIENTTYDGDQLIQNSSTVATLYLDPNDISKKLEIGFTNVDIVDTTNLEIDGDAGNQTEERALELIDEQYGNALSYLGEVTGQIRSVDAHASITESVIENGNAYESTINEVNDAEELNRVVTNEIRQQASLAMLSQASMYRMGVLSLLK
ncbi:MAG: hypothetical protein GF344_18120 [Chitinivibrionales bacterium]|nr:hypothetical protein [Chitinivibrionales bacterium]MBD3358574.1 hypothetical protein [Chitinivibrionales bacterium]